MDSSLAGGDNDAHAGLDESDVRNDSEPVLLPNSSPFEKIFWSMPNPRHLGGAKADGSGRFEGNGLTNAPPPPKGLVPLAVDTAGLSGCRK